MLITLGTESIKYNRVNGVSPCKLSTAGYIFSLLTLCLQKSLH